MSRLVVYYTCKTLFISFIRLSQITQFKKKLSCISSDFSSNCRKFYNLCIFHYLVIYYCYYNQFITVYYAMMRYILLKISSPLNCHRIGFFFLRRCCGWNLLIKLYVINASSQRWLHSSQNRWPYCSLFLPCIYRSPRYVYLLLMQ